MGISEKTIKGSGIDYIFFLALVFSVPTIPFLHIELLGYFPSLPVFIIVIYLYFKVTIFDDLLASNIKTILSSYLLGFLLWSSWSMVWSDTENWHFLVELAFYITFVIVSVNFCKIDGIFLLKINRLLFYLIFILVLFGFSRLISVKSSWFEFINHLENGHGTRNSDVFMVITSSPVLISYVLSFNHNYWIKAVALLGTLVLYSAILLSLSRGLLVTSLIVLIFLLFVYTLIYRPRIRSILGGFTIFSFVSLIIYFIVSDYFYSTGQLLIDRFYSIEESRRIDLAILAWETGVSNPLAGIGIDNFKFTTPDGVHAHNAYLNLFSELGLPGVGVFCLAVIYPFWGYIRLIRKVRCSSDDSEKMLYLQGVGMSLTLLISLFFSTFYNFIYFWIIYMFCCLDLFCLMGKGRPFKHNTS